MPDSMITDDQGATAVEYGLMMALIFVVIITSVVAVGLNLNAIFEEVAGLLPG